jgi:hypothetical protein
VPEPGDDAVALTGTVKVTITRESDGSTLVSEGSTTEAGEPAYWSYTIPGTSLARLDVLTAVWTDGTSSYTTTAEIVGGFVCSLNSIAEKLDEPGPTDPADLAKARELALRDIERACHVNFRPRFVKERVTGDGTATVALSNREPRRILKATIDGTDLSGEELSALELSPSGLVTKPSGVWRRGADLVIAYEAGYASYPEAARHVRDLAASYLTANPVDWMDRATSYTNDYGPYSMVTPGMRGAAFALPNVNAFVESFYVPLVA